MRISIPKTILEKKEISRELNFTSTEMMKKFRILQQVSLHGNVIEEWYFKIGFVMPGSTNTYQSTIEAAQNVIPAEILSGNVVIETSFLEEDLFICKNVVRVFYE
jgi:retinal rod rhodopsin-sensitive cGMP 3',5'-cyclic phosphodiesterase subunit delta